MAKVWDRDSMNILFGVLAKTMQENREMLITLDSEIGDGDLGITMNKAFTVAAETVVMCKEVLPGKVCIEAGKIMAKNAPSTMGTLMATGFMYGGKALGDSEVITGESLTLFFEGFLEGVMKRGKASPGEKTLIDVLYPVVTALKIADLSDLEAALIVAKEASSTGLKRTKDLVSQHGKAAIYREQTLGKVDPGAKAMDLVIQSLVV